MQRLNNHEIDVIVQVRKLGEGFDHPYLAVAAVLSIFSNLSPFVQFIGRIMRVIVQNSPGNLKNLGTVVFHAGANVASRWADFQEYSEADQEFFDQLLPMEGLDFSDAGELEIEPAAHSHGEGLDVDIKSQSVVELEEIPLIENDPDALDALKVLQERGYTSDQIQQAYEKLVPIPVTRVRQRQAMRSSLDQRVQQEAGRILNERGINPQSHELDRQRLGRPNFVVIKSAIDRQINTLIDRGSGERHEVTRPELELINSNFDDILQQAIEEVLDATD
jgi:superfamily II DNA or RNA helicase